MTLPSKIAPTQPEEFKTALNDDRGGNEKDVYCRAVLDYLSQMNGWALWMTENSLECSLTKCRTIQSTAIDAKRSLVHEHLPALANKHGGNTWTVKIFGPAFLGILDEYTRLINRVTLAESELSHMCSKRIIDEANGRDINDKTAFLESYRAKKEASSILTRALSDFSSKSWLYYTQAHNRYWSGR